MVIINLIFYLEIIHKVLATSSLIVAPANCFHLSFYNASKNAGGQAFNYILCAASVTGVLAISPI